MDEIEIASQIATELWNGRCPDYPVKIMIKSYNVIGNVVVADARIFFCQETDCMDGEMQVGDNHKSWDHPIEFVYGWLECIEECFNAIYE